MSRLPLSFYTRDVLEVAPQIVGKRLCVERNQILNSFIISEVEAYKGGEDKACHASKGRTKRTEVMFQQGGIIYMYLIYGMHWMINIVTAEKDNPQAVLIRGLEQVNGPGRLSKFLNINGTYNGISLIESDEIWLEEGLDSPVLKTSPRIGINYAGEPWISKPWRYFIPEMVNKLL